MWVILKWKKNYRSRFIVAIDTNSRISRENFKEILCYKLFSFAKLLVAANCHYLLTLFVSIDLSLVLFPF